MKRQLVARIFSLFVILLILTACAIEPISPPAEPSMEASSSTESFCILDPDGGTFGSHGGALLSSRTGTTVGTQSGSEAELHGNLVWSTIENALSGSGAIEVTESAQITQTVSPVVILVTDEFSGTNPNLVDRQALWHVPNLGDILVVGLDMHDFVVSEATQGISAAINSFTLGTNVTLSNGLTLDVAPVDKFVINMSWMIVPCDAIPESTEDYLQLLCDGQNQETVSRLEELNAFQETLRRLNLGEVEELCANVRARNIDMTPRNARLNRTLEEFAARPEARRLEVLAITQVNPFLQELEDNPNEPLHNLLDCFDRVLQRSGKCLEINSQAPLSLNNLRTFRNDRKIPYTVISVAAAGNSGAHYPFAPAMMDSVIAVSASYTPVTPSKVANYSNWGEIQMPGEHPDGVHEGTSMSAPRLSVIAAKYLLDGGTSPCAPNTSVKPVLGFKKKGDHIDQLPVNRVNLTLKMAAARYCRSFPDQ